MNAISPIGGIERLKLENTNCSKKNVFPKYIYLSNNEEHKKLLDDDMNLGMKQTDSNVEQHR